MKPGIDGTDIAYFFLSAVPRLLVTCLLTWSSVHHHRVAPEPIQEPGTFQVVVR
jgi:hypothetical protein